MTNSGQSKLYWNGGRFRVSISHASNIPVNTVGQAIAVLEEFRVDSQKQYMAFDGVVNGRNEAYKRYENMFKPVHRDKKISVGTGPPDSPQLPGSSTIATMTQGEFLEGLKPGGEFENQHAKALIVLIYHLWDEKYRRRLSQIFSLPLRNIRCSLMGDIRQVRNLIIHEDSMVPPNFPRRLELLPEIWNFEVGNLKITAKMVHSFMEQLNAIRVDTNET